MKRHALALVALPLLLTVGVLADDAVRPVETLADLEAASPAWVYQQLRSQPGVSPDSPKTLAEVLKRTGHSRTAALRLLKMQARASTHPLQLPWVNDDRVRTASAELKSRRAAARTSIERRIAAGLSTTQAAVVLRDCYRASLHSLADSVIASRSDVCRFDRLPEGVTLTPSYRYGQLRITVSRAAAAAPLAVAIPPGTISQALGSGSQDLALLEATVVVLAAGSTHGGASVATACAGYGFSSPSRAYAYGLRPCEPGSPLDSLLKRVCTKPFADAPSQLAVWIAGDNITTARWENTQTFRGARVGPEHVKAAAELLIESGVDPRGLNLFGGSASEEANATP
jgi:hypothetical protein